MSTETRNDLISVIVTCFREGRYLDDCLLSVRDQTHREVEIIVIDDGGTDDSLAIACDHALSDDRIRILRSDHNVGLGAVRNIALGEASGSLVTFVDGDDFLTADSLTIRLDALNTFVASHPAIADKVVGSYGSWRHTIASANRDQAPGNSRELEIIDLPATQAANQFIVSAPLLRTDSLRQTGGFAEGLPAAEDYLAWMKLLAAGHIIVPVDGVVSYYRQKPNSMLRTTARAVAEITTEIQQWFISVIDDVEVVDPSDYEEPHRSMALSLRSGTRRLDAGAVAPARAKFDQHGAPVVAPRDSASPVAGEPGPEALRARQFLESSDGLHTNHGFGELAIRRRRTGGADALTIEAHSWIEAYEATLLAEGLERSGVAATLRLAPEASLGLAPALGEGDVWFDIQPVTDDAPTGPMLRYRDWSMLDPEPKRLDGQPDRLALRPCGLRGLEWTPRYAAKRFRTGRPVLVQGPVEAAALADREPVVSGSPIVERMRTLRSAGISEEILIVCHDGVGDELDNWIGEALALYATLDLSYTARVVSLSSRVAGRSLTHPIEVVGVAELARSRGVIVACSDEAFLTIAAGAPLLILDSRIDTGPTSMLSSLGVPVIDHGTAGAERAALRFAAAIDVGSTPYGEYFTAGIDTTLTELLDLVGN